MTLATFLNSHAGIPIKITESTINTMILILLIHENQNFAKSLFHQMHFIQQFAKVSLYTIHI